MSDDDATPSPGYYWAHCSRVFITFAPFSRIIYNSYTHTIYSV